MTAVFFDTYVYANRLIAGGMSPDAARVEAQMMREVMARISKIEALTDTRDAEKVAPEWALEAKLERPGINLNSKNEVLRSEMRMLRADMSALHYEMEAKLQREMMKMTYWTAYMCFVLMITMIVLAVPS